MSRMFIAMILALACAAPVVAQDGDACKCGKDGCGRSTAAAPGGKPVTIDVERASLFSILKRLCAEQGYNFVADPRVLDRAGDVALVLKDVAFEDALSAMGDLYDLEIRVRGKIVTVRGKEAVPPPRPVAATPPKADAVAPVPASAPKAEPAKADVAKTDTPSRTDPPKTEPKPEAAPSVAKATPEPARPEPAPFDPNKVEGKGPPPGSAMGVVVDANATQLKLKERGGDARDFFVPEARKDDLSMRGTRIAQALKGLKKGDLVALTFEVDEHGRAVITNIIGGPKRGAGIAGADAPR
jgi:hypothetical protein